MTMRLDENFATILMINNNISLSKWKLIKYPHAHIDNVDYLKIIILIND